MVLLLLLLLLLVWLLKMLLVPTLLLLTLLLLPPLPLVLQELMLAVVLPQVPIVPWSCWCCWRGLRRAALLRSSASPAAQPVGRLCEARRWLPGCEARSQILSCGGTKVAAGSCCGAGEARGDRGAHGKCGVSGATSWCWRCQ